MCGAALPPTAGEDGGGPMGDSWYQSSEEDYERGGDYVRDGSASDDYDDGLDYDDSLWRHNY